MVNIRNFLNSCMMGNSKYLKMKPVKEDFEINENDGIVKCYQTWSFFIPKEIAQTLIFNGKFNREWSEKLAKDNRNILITTVGTAKRIKTDIWNEKIGKHIAATKASKKAYEKYFKLTRKIWMAFRDINILLDNTLMASIDFKTDATEHLKKLQNQ